METLTMALLGLVVLAGMAFVLLQIIQRQRRLQAELDRLEKLTAEAAMTAEAALDQVDERIERMNQLVALLEQKVKRDVAAATGADGNAAAADGEAAGARRGRSRRKKAEAASEEAPARKEEPAARKEGQTRKRGRPRKKAEEAAAPKAGGDGRPAAEERIQAAAEPGVQQTAAAAGTGAGATEAATATGIGSGAVEAAAGPEVRAPQWERLDPPGKGGAGQAPDGGADQLAGGGTAQPVQSRAGADQAADGRLHPKVQAVVELAKQGRTPLEIAEELGIPRGEVQLILSVRRHTA